jgi:hypothetical protein
MFNNAWKTEFYNQIDQALAKVPMLTGANTFTGSQTIAGVLVVTALGGHSFTASVPGKNTVVIQNGDGGSTSGTSITLGNNLDSTMFAASTFSSTYPANGTKGEQPSGTLFEQHSYGIVFAATAASGKHEFWTGGAKRWTMGADGSWSAGLIVGGQTFSNFMPGFQTFSNAGTASATAIYFQNANGVVGSVTTAGSATAFNTSSDARLKSDRGLARDTSILERTEIHDYDWIADGTRGRGVFSQDAHRVAPFANAPGTDERDDEGRLVRPWSTDYSKYVPDLIVGWQQHREELAALRAELAALKG